MVHKTLAALAVRLRCAVAAAERWLSPLAECIPVKPFMSGLQLDLRQDLRLQVLKELYDREVLSEEAHPVAADGGVR
jgi:hypothetical protein